MKGLLLLLAGLIPLGNHGQPLSQLRVAGNQIVNEGGEPVLLRGLNASDPDKLFRSGHWTKAYLAEMKAWGAKVVRFPVHPRAWRAQGADAYLRILDQGVQWASELGLYVIIDWHSIGNLRTELYQSEGYETTQKETFEFWRLTADHYGNHPTIAAFELYNEPTTQGGKLGTCSWQQWKELVEEMITIIRAHGCQTIALVGGFNWAYDLTPVAEAPIEAEGVAYVSHPYPQKREAPWEAQWTADWGFVAERHPLVLTEIGFCGPDERGAHIPVVSDERYGEAIHAYCEARGISYLAWVFDPQWSPMLIKDWDYTPTRQGRFFKQVLGGGLPAEVPSGVYAWETSARQSWRGQERRSLFEGATNHLAYLEVDAQTLPPGQDAYTPMRPDREELIIVKEGSLNVRIGQDQQTMGKGSVAWIMPGDAYAIVNVGAIPATYYRLVYQARGGLGHRRAEKAGGSLLRDWDHITFEPQEKGGVRRFFNRPSAICEYFEMHTTTLKPGIQSHPLHTHEAEEVILVLEGEVEEEIDGKWLPAQAGDVIFLASEVPHAIRNRGQTACTYFAFQWR